MYKLDISRNQFNILFMFYIFYSVVWPVFKHPFYIKAKYVDKQHNADFRNLGVMSYPLSVQLNTYNWSYVFNIFMSDRFDIQVPIDCKQSQYNYYGVFLAFL